LGGADILMRKKGDFFNRSRRVGWFRGRVDFYDMFDMMATVELSQAGDSSILIIYKAGNSGNIRNEQKAIHFASCQAISQSKTGHKNT